MEHGDTRNPAEGTQGARLGKISGGYSSGTADVVAPAQTLTRALSQLDELNKRLQVLSGTTQQIAQAIGGPFPLPVPNNSKQDGGSAMQRLNHSINDALDVVNDIDTAMGAIQRALVGA